MSETKSFVDTLKSEGLPIPEALIIRPATLVDKISGEVNLSVGMEINGRKAGVWFEGPTVNPTISAALVYIVNELRQEASPDDETPYRITLGEAGKVILGLFVGKP